MESKNRIVTFLILIFLSSTSFLQFVPIVDAQEEPVTLLSIHPDVFYQTNGSLTLDINITHARGVYAFDVVLEFPKNWRFFKVVGIEEGNFFLPFSSAFGYKTDYRFDEYFHGILNFAGTMLGQFNGKSGNGTLAKVTLEILDGGDYRIGFRSSTLLNATLNKLPHETMSAYSICKGNKPEYMDFCFYNKEETIYLDSPYGLGSIPERYGLDSVILNYTGEVVWKVEFTSDYVDFYYDEKTTGTVDIYDSSLTLLDTYTFKRNLEFYDKYRDACERTGIGYEVDWWSQDIEILKFEFDIKKLYELYITCNGGTWQLWN